jgi:hypothetical protein
MASDVFVSQSEIESKVDLAVDLNRQIKALTKKTGRVEKRYHSRRGIRCLPGR